MPTAELGWWDEEGTLHPDTLVRFGPSIKVLVTPYPDPNQSEPAPHPAARLTLALVDTGAAESCIDTQLAEQLGLPAIDTKWLAGVGGATEHPVFMAYVSVPELGLTHYGRFAGVELSDGGQQHGVLLGRTFLSGVTMVYDGPNASVRVSRRAQPEEGA